MYHYKKLYSNHAVKQMFQRSISTFEVEHVIKYGELLKEYPDDNPYPSKLLFAVYDNRPIHVVCSFNEDDKIIIIVTVYEPSIEIWGSNFRKRKKN